ncbi:MAG TPA: hypothetical protein VFG73_00630 [Rhodanobacteraceae bacterium]|nr:hypothetical protein [Rhodanobacteraceae bacterium]
MTKLIPVFVAAALCGALAAPAAHADVLLIKQVRKEQQLQMPTRGMSMAQVERKFGAPLRKLDTRGGDTPKHPPIHRWVYPGYIVYFERSHVIHSVINPPQHAG